MQLNTKIISALILLPLALTGCSSSSILPQKSPIQNPPASPPTTESNHIHTQMSMDRMSYIALPTEGRLDVLKETQNSTGGVDFIFKIKDDTNHELTPENLTTVHEKKLHMIVVDEKLQNFQHIHPEYKDKSWQTQFSLPHEGLYYVYLDIAPLKANSQVLLYKYSLTTSKSIPKQNFPPLTPNQTVKVDNYEVKMQSSMDFMAGMPMDLNFTLTQNGKPVETIDPYLGAFGHVVILSHEKSEFYLHVHPITETKPENGKVVFNTTFPEGGRYTVFAQFQINGKVLVFPITIDVMGENTMRMDHQMMNHSMH